MFSINCALKLLTRNSGLSCLKTQSGSWKHCRFLDLWKLASSMRLLTALCVWYSGEAIWNNPCLVIFFSLSLSLSHCLLLTLVLSCPLLSFSLFPLYPSCVHTHTSFPPPRPPNFFLSFFFLSKITLSNDQDPVKVLQSWEEVRGSRNCIFRHSQWQLKWQQGQALPSLFFNAVSTNFARIILSDAWVDFVIFHIVPPRARISFKRVN